MGFTNNLLFFMRIVHDTRMNIVVFVQEGDSLPTTVFDSPSQIYGSAVPHINCSYVSNKNDFQEGTPARKVMDLTVFLVLVLQYYGALVHTANSVCDGGAASAHPVFLMLLGGGVFKNPDYYITTAISAAQEMYKLYVKEQKTQDCLDVQVLTWKSNSSEVNDISNLFIGMGRPVQRTDRL